MTPLLRRLVPDAWGVPVTDVYSAQEVGYIALQCPQGDGYHAQAEHLLVEILDEDGRPCEAGETGRVVVTTLHNLASPLIRYELGDYAVAGGRCPCGRGLPLIERVMGRERHMAILPSGERFWPSFPEEDWMSVAPIRQLQLVQKSVERIEARVAASRPLNRREERRLSDAFGAALGHPFQFDFLYVNEIPRGSNGKFEDFVCEVDRPGSAGG